MLTIARLLRAHNQPVDDLKLGWGARASAYLDPICAALAQGRTPVTIELKPDLPMALQQRVRSIDHHGTLAGATAPTALEQVFELLQLPPLAWTRELQLVAANDRGYLPEMAALGATPEEMQHIRAADRAAQGVTEAEEIAARRAIDSRECVGELTVLRLPHSRASVAADLMEPLLGGPGAKRLLVLSPNEVNFYADGASIDALDHAFGGGWKGGALPIRGFWGHAQVMPETVADFLRDHERNLRKQG